MLALLRKTNQFCPDSANPSIEPHHNISHCCGQERQLEGVRNIRPGKYERLARNPHNSLVRSTTGGCRQLRDGIGRDVAPDNGEIAGVKFENVRTALERRCLRSEGVRIRSKSA